MIKVLKLQMLKIKNTNTHRMASHLSIHCSSQSATNCKE